MKNINHKIQSSKIVSKFSYAVIKRIIDIFGGSILFILFIPVYIIIVIIIKIDSRGAVLYKWHVVGKNGVPFNSWKFRTMVPKADEIKINLSVAFRDVWNQHRLEKSVSRDQFLFFF